MVLSGGGADQETKVCSTDRKLNHQIKRYIVDQDKLYQQNKISRSKVGWTYTM